MTKLSSTTPFKINIHTFGCKVNTYDSGLLQDSLKAFSFFKSPCTEIHILNTCAVTQAATLSALKSIKKIKKTNPEACVVVTGCGAQVDTDQFANLEQADLIVANSHKHQMADILKEYFEGTLNQRVLKSNIFKKMDLGEGGGEEASHSRSFLKIQDGCNSFCTFCVIPFARGKSRSLSVESIINKVIDLEKKGFKEVVITGIHIGDYQDSYKGKVYKVEDLVEEILLQTKISRIRISSLEPVELSDRLLQLYKTQKRLCPHFHMSMQSASTKILKSMKRNYTQKEVLNALDRIYQCVPNAFVGMDFIVGFPGETEDDFLDTYQSLKKAPWTRLHVFPYSQRPGTYATRLPNPVEEAVIQSRARRLRELNLLRYKEEALKQVGVIKKVLPLHKGERFIATDYWHIQLENTNTTGLQQQQQKQKQQQQQRKPLELIEVTGVNTGDNFFSTPLLGRLV